MYRLTKTIFLAVLLCTVVLAWYRPTLIPHVQAFDADTDVFFETGAETGTVGEEPQPPWDIAGPNGGGDHSESYVHVDTTHVRTGDNAIKFYQTTPIKSSAQRRVELREYSNMKKEYYVSWWCYFDSDGIDDTEDVWTTLGGVQFFWDEEGGSGWQWYMGARFVITDIFTGHPDRTIRFSNSWSASGFSTASNQPPTTDRYDSNYKISDYMDQWVHFQVFIKWSNTTDGYATGWFNNNLIGNATGKRNDPIGYLEWSSKNCFAGYGPNYPFALSEFYQPTTSAEGWYWMDDFVVSDTKVSESYGVDYQSSTFEDWENGFEEGDFTAWNNTEYANGGSAPQICTDPTYLGTYSANFTTDGSDGSYSRAIHVVQNVSSIYQRTRVRFEDLPDTNNTEINVLRLGTTDDAWIASVGVYNLSGSNYWFVEVTGFSKNYTGGTIAADTWYLLEFHLDASASGNATLWVDEVETCSITGDMSGVGDIARVYPYIYIDGAQATGKTVYHDVYRVDNERIGGGTPEVFQVNIQTTEESGTPIAGVTINGTYTTDAYGYYEWTNLTYHTLYTFVVEGPIGYYPAWCLNINGDYSWNGTHYTLSHNVTESHTGYLELCFYQTSSPYVSESDIQITCASYSSSILYATTESTSGSKTIKVYSANRPTYILNKNYTSTDYASNLFTITYTYTTSVTWTVSYESFDGIDIQSTDGELTAVSYSTDLLEFTISKTGTSSTTIYCPSQGEPGVIYGSTDYAFDVASSILTINVTHSSAEDVMVEWSVPTPDVPIRALSNDVQITTGATFRTRYQNTSYTTSSTINVLRTVTTARYLWIDKTYTTKHYTRYCLYITSPDNVSFTITSWFTGTTSTATLTINTPLATAIYLNFYSPDLTSAYATGVVSYSWNATSQTLAMTCNSNVNPITIHATATETEVNITPENYAVSITDMEGCGNWVFSQSEYYTFQTQVWDGDGYGDIDQVKVAFTDGVHWINATYDADDGYSLDNGEDYVRLRDGTQTTLDDNLLQVTFLFYFEESILDALNVNLYLYCNDDAGDYDDWQLMEADYFNIYNLGGHSTLTSGGDAGRILGGEIFDLYANNSAWATNTVLFRNLQHIKLKPEVLLTYSGPDNYIKYAFDYCVDDTWLTGLELAVKLDGGSIGGSEVYTNCSAEWWYNDVLIRNDTFYVFNEVDDVIVGTNFTQEFWVDLWINRENASSVISGRVNAYYYPMTDSANPWFRWLTGSNWGIYVELPKESMFAIAMTDGSGTVVHASQIEMMQISCTVTAGASQFIQINNHEIFDMTFGTDPLEGVVTPSFDETKTPIMPQGGFIGALWSGLRWLGDEIGKLFGPAQLRLWDLFRGFLDTVFGAFGLHGFGTYLTDMIGDMWGWVQDSLYYVFVFIYNGWLLITSFIAKFVNTLGTMVGQWVTMINTFFAFLGDTYTGGVHIWNDLGLSTWVILAAILYPLLLLSIWETKGFDAMMAHIKMMLDIGAWIARFFLTIIQFFIRIVTAIIESIPVIE